MEEVQQRFGGDTQLKKVDPTIEQEERPEMGGETGTQCKENHRQSGRKQASKGWGHLAQGGLTGLKLQFI